MNSINKQNICFIQNEGGLFHFLQKYPILTFSTSIANNNNCQSKPFLTLMETLKSDKNGNEVTRFVKLQRQLHSKV